MPNLPTWVKELTGENFLAVYDVVLDIRQALQMSEHRPEIPLLQSIVKFSALMPGDGINMRDRYCEFRWNATEVLKKRGVIEDFEYIRSFHRWDGRIIVTADVAVFTQFASALDEEFARRTKSTEVPVDSSQDLVAGPPDPMEKVRKLLLRFHAVVVQLRQRREGRPTLDVEDEYDVQDLLHALLLLEFDDVRREEWTPSYAGKSSRVDFLLKAEEIVIEVKKTRSGLGAKEVGDQLILDRERYSKMKGCRALLCFVYDPENRIANPGGLQADLNGEFDGFRVEAFVLPKSY